MKNGILASTRMSWLGRRAGAVLGALAAVLVVWVIGHLVGVTPPDVRMTPSGTVQQVGLPSIVVTCLLAGIVAVLLVSALERLTRHPRRDWVVVSIVLLLLSLLGPLGAAATAQAGLFLLCMHLAAAAVLIPTLFLSIPVTAERGSPAAT
jgi:hypothetical protein